MAPKSKKKQETGRKKPEERAYERKYSPVAFTEIEINAISNGYTNLITDKGSFANLYRGSRNFEPVAIKKYRLPDEIGYRNQYNNEKNIYLRTNHPNIVSLVGFNDDTLQLVLEYLPRDLQSLIDDNDQPLDAQNIVNIAKQIVDGIKYMNGEDIAIGDLSASNILVDNRNRVKICDFGGAVPVGGMVEVYSQYYTAPEGLKGSSQQESDIYSLGVLIIEMIAKEQVTSFGVVPNERKLWRKQLKEAEKQKVTEKSETIHITALARQRQFRTNWLKDREGSQYIALFDLGLACTEFEPRSRPKFDDIIQELNNINGSAGTS